MNKSLFLHWYFELPAQQLDTYIFEQHVNIHLKTLLLAHERSEIPFTLTINGALLNEIDRKYPALIKEMASLVDRSICEIGVSTYHDVFTAFLTPEYIAKHLQRDIDIKLQLFGKVCGLYFPTSFAWLTCLPPILRKTGQIDMVLLSAEHNYNAMFDPGSPLQYKFAQNKSFNTLDFDSLSYDFNRIHRLTAPASELNILFRNDLFQYFLSYGKQGALHRPFDEAALKTSLDYLDESKKLGRLVVFSDDGDRITHCSYSQYSSFLRRLSREDVLTCADIKAAQEDKKRNIEYIPSSFEHGYYDFWQSHADGIYYQKLIDFCQAHPNRHEFEDELLECQSLFAAFWKAFDNKQYYWEKLQALYEKLLDSEHRSLTTPSV